MIKNKNKTNKENWEWFDDCEICKAEKDAEKRGRPLSYKELQNAFKKANEEGISDLYYDAMEFVEGNRNDLKKAERLLIRAEKIDNKNVQVMTGFVHLYGRLKDKTTAQEHIKKAYQETLRQFPKWPRRMEWGILENRPFMRAIQYQADLHADEGEKDKAIDLYRLLLKLNPNDNQGVRYTCAGLYAGISGEKVNSMMDDGNRKQNWDELKNLVKIQNVKHLFWKEPKY